MHVLFSYNKLYYVTLCLKYDCRYFNYNLKIKTLAIYVVCNKIHIQIQSI